MVYSGLMLFVTPPGRIAHWSDWTLWGLTKDQYGAIHINFMILFIMASAFHLYFNWKVLMAYLKDRVRRLVVFNREFIAALLLCLVVLTGTLAEWPPFRELIAFNTDVKESWGESYGEPPYGHAELSPLALFVQRLGLDPEVARQRLADGGISVEGMEQTLADMAEKNGVSPQDLYRLMAPESPGNPSANATPAGEVLIAGLGRKTLEDLAGMNLIRMPDARRWLESKGVNAPAGASLKDLAAALGMNPRDLLDQLREVREAKEE
jgi:hypothetical protein